MSQTDELVQHLDHLCSQGQSGWKEARTRAQSIRRAELVQWLDAQVGNPGAQRYLLELYDKAWDPTLGSAQFYQQFVRALRLRQRPHIERKVLGWGEISQVAEIAGGPFSPWRHPATGAEMRVVYKKMPPFLNRADADEFVRHYLTYNTVLRDELDIAVPAFDARISESPSGEVIIFVIQERVDPASVCHRILQEIGPAAAARLYGSILQEFAKLFRFNLDHAKDKYQIGLDGQIPNWAVDGYEGDPDSLTGEERLIYVDTNVPMIRIDGQDVVSTDMYFQALPGGARWLIKRLNLDQEVMDRYFEVRLVILDFLGNIIVRHREDLVEALIEQTNQALTGPFAEGAFQPFTMKEVQAYYRSDVSTWRLWRSLKLIGALSDGVSAGNWSVLKRTGELYRIWTEPIF